MAPDILQNCFFGLPGGSQATFGRLLRPTRCPRSFSEQFWMILGGFWDPRTMKKHKKVLNCLQKTRLSRFLLGACRRSATSSQNHPRSIPRDPKSDPGGVKSGPGEPQERPGRGSGAARRHPKIGLYALLPAGEPQERPGEAQEPPQRGPGSDFGASRASFGSFLGAPGTSFLSFFGAVQGRCACSHYVPQMLGRRVPR